MAAREKNDLELLKMIVLFNWTILYAIGKYVYLWDTCSIITVIFHYMYSIISILAIYTVICSIKGLVKQNWYLDTLIFM